MDNLKFDSWEELKTWMKSDDVEGVTSSTRKTTRPLTTARVRLQELLNEIRTICQTSPWNMKGVIYNADIRAQEFGNGKHVVYAPFRINAWRPSKWDWYDSFIPVLMDRGWLWKDEKPNKKGRSFPTYQYFIGTHEIEAAISRFNAKNAALGFRAYFDVEDDSRVWPTGK